jgi:hypothetical protein
MSCERYQQRLVDALAGGEGALGGELAAHLLECAECRKFHETQVHLFGAIDFGVRAMVNETVPASLLPGLRARVAEDGIPRQPWGFTWGFASLAVVAVLAVSVGLLMRGPGNSRRVGDRSPVVARDVGGAQGVTPRQPREAAAAPIHARAQHEVAKAPQVGAAAPEVLILPEEQAAFIRFVTDLPEERDVAVAFTRPATDGNGEAVEIALLQINELEVKPLESSNQ